VLTDAEIFAEVTQTPRRAFVPLPDLELVERPGWFQITTPSFREGGFNEVALAVLADGDADAVIDATIAGYRARGLKFRWTVGPDSAPADLADRLARRGLARSIACGMARATTPVTGGDGVTVTEIDASTSDTFTRTMAAGWETDPAPLARVHDLILANPQRTQHLFLARIDGEPAGTAAYVAFPRSAYLLGAVVLPAFRGRGVYRALVDARLAHARARGLALATSHAREQTSAPILAGLGFRAICKLSVFGG